MTARPGAKRKQWYETELLTVTENMYLSKTFIFSALNTYLFSICKWVFGKLAFFIYKNRARKEIKERRDRARRGCGEGCRVQGVGTCSRPSIRAEPGRRRGRNPSKCLGKAARAKARNHACKGPRRGTCLPCSRSCESARPRQRPVLQNWMGSEREPRAGPRKALQGIRALEIHPRWGRRPWEGSVQWRDRLWQLPLWRRVERVGQGSGGVG